MPAALAMLLAIPILAAIAILGRISSSPRPRRSRRYAAIGAMEVPRPPRSWIVLGWAL